MGLFRSSTSVQMITPPTDIVDTRESRLIERDARIAEALALVDTELPAAHRRGDTAAVNLCLDLRSALAPSAPGSFVPSGPAIRPVPYYPGRAA